MEKKKITLSDQDYQMFRLFQQLTIEQCLELMKKNYSNYSAYLRKLLFAVIGSKLYWGDKYVPDYNPKKIIIINII